ncbi:tyrosine type site-specific recombinase, partial [human gut metagenome]
MAAKVCIWIYTAMATDIRVPEAVSYPGTDNNTRRQNEITMAAANAIKSKRIIELTSGEAGIVNHTDKVYLLDWMQTYLEYQEKRDKKGIGQI